MLFRGDPKLHCEFEQWAPCIGRYSRFWGGNNSRLSLAVRGVVEQYSSLPSLVSQLILSNYDIIHTGDGLVGKWLRRLLAVRGDRAPRVILNNAASSLEFCRGFDYVEVVAPYYLEEAGKLGLDTRNWFVNPYWADTSLFRPATHSERANARGALGIPEKSTVVLSVGAVEPSHKRMDYLVKEVAKSREKVNERIFLLIVGASAGYQTGAIRELGASLLKTDYKILTDVGHERIHELYRTADIFILASLHDYFPMAIIEALASGLPTIVHHAQVQRWMAGGGGRFVAMDKPDSLAHAIVEFVNDPVASRSYGMRARERALALFSPASVIPRIVEMYQRVAGHRK
ncbi:MAG: glycosyltransferase family 4 protein [Nitrososphaerales archaeon]|nr:glycosyltransferase family 4 protein [Nitrososphaerales archaeon]